MKQTILAILLLFPVSLSAQKWKPIEARFDSIAMLCEKTRNATTPPREYTRWLKEMYAMASSRRDKRMEWRALYWDAWYYDGIGRDDIALQKIRKAIDMVDSVEYHYDYHRMKWVELITSEYADMLKINRMARRELKYYEKIDDKLMMGVMWLNIGRIHERAKVFDKALECYNEHLKNMKEAGFDNGADNTLIMYYMELGDTVKAQEVYTKALAMGRRDNDTLSIVSTYTMAYTMGLDPSAVFKAYDWAKGCSTHNVHYYNAFINLGAHYIYNNEPEQGLELYRYVEESTRNSRFQGLDGVRVTSLAGIGTCYEMLGEADSALRYMTRHFVLRDSLDHLNSTASYQEMYEKLAYEHEEEMIEQEKARSRNRLIALGGIFSVALLGAALALYYVHSRRRLKEAENKELAAKVEAERLQRELFQERSENSERQLATNSLMLTEKMRMIDYLNRQIEAEAQEGKIDGTARRSLQNFIKLHQGAEEDMSKFYDYFTNVHPDFFKKLKEGFPELTKSDLRLCAYLRMGLDSKQIAQILSLQPDGVKKARYRLRKKLGLKTGESLESYLMFV